MVKHYKINDIVLYHKDDDFDLAVIKAIKIVINNNQSEEIYSTDKGDFKIGDILGTVERVYDCYNLIANYNKCLTERLFGDKFDKFMKDIDEYKSNMMIKGIKNQK